MIFTLYQLILLVLLAGLALWILGLWGLALRSVWPRPRPAESGATPFFAIIIPAHDEGAVITRTVAFVRACDYPPDRLALYVVADNCTDDTAALARAGGAVVLERTDAVNKGKGHALAFALSRVKAEVPAADAVLFLDADSSPAPDYLRVMARYVARGDRVIQGRYEVDGPDRNWFTRLTSVSFVFRNRWQFPGLDALGLTLPLRGSGMCFAAPLIHDLGWVSHGLTEDLEMTLRLVRADIPIAFAPGAVSAQFMPATPAEAVTQRVRWSAGERGVRGVLLKQEVPWAVRAGRWRAAASLLLMAAPPFSLQLMAALAAAVAAIWAGPALFAVAAGVVVAYGGYFLLGLERLDRLGIEAALMLPVFVLWRVGVYVLACVKKPVGWLRTERK